ncbi:MAG: galactokinase, partial [Candidatus Sericytochromatia bacterium]|nr:galactokinase [Candidatus Sericytochromatia bacterium]
LNLTKIDLVKLSQKAENEFVGVKCGIMDQFISVFGKKDSVLKLDCRDLSYEYFPFNFNDVKIVLFDTQVKHSLASSAYNTRREQCESGVKILQKYDNNILSLRDVSLSMIEKYESEFDDEIYKRCNYVIKENLRLLNACQDLKNNDLVSFGKMMFESHEGLKNEYQVSCQELDLLVDLVKDDSSVMGSRMMGGGFGGCTINLIKEEFIDQVSANVRKEYKKRTGIDLKVYVDKIQDGTSEIGE